MKEPVVPDSSCLIALERIHAVHLLPALFEPIAVPPEVAREFGTSLSWLRVQVPENRALVAALQLLVDDGEAEAIALAAERSWRIILDDRRARLIANRVGLRLIGTLGVLVRAKRAGVISLVRPLLDRLDQRNFAVASR